MRISKTVSAPSPAAIRNADFSLGKEVAIPEIGFVTPTDFRFDSQVSTRSTENNTVYGKFFRAREDWRARPTLILIHGWNAEYCYRFQFPGLARRLTRAGVNAAMVELPYHCQRRPRRDGAVKNFISEDLDSVLEAAEQSVADIRALARWLREQGNPAVGLWGFSLGAWLAGLTICSDNRFDFAVLLTPPVRIERAIAELDFCEPIRRALAQNSVPLSGLDLLGRRPAIPLEKILLIESRHDIFLPAETVEELWRAWGEPEIWRVNHGHISIMMSRIVMDHAVNWITNKLALDCNRFNVFNPNT